MITSKQVRQLADEYRLTPIERATVTVLADDLESAHDIIDEMRGGDEGARVAEQALR